MKRIRDQIRAEIFNSHGFLVQKRDNFTEIDLSKLADDNYTIRYYNGYGIELSHDHYIRINHKGYIVTL
jgi:hypothetical protein